MRLTPRHRRSTSKGILSTIGSSAIVTVAIAAGMHTIGVTAPPDCDTSNTVQSCAVISSTSQDRSGQDSSFSVVALSGSNGNQVKLLNRGSLVATDITVVGFFTEGTNLPLPGRFQTATPTADQLVELVSDEVVTVEIDQVPAGSTSVLFELRPASVTEANDLTLTLSFGAETQGADSILTDTIGGPHIPGLELSLPPEIVDDVVQELAGRSGISDKVDESTVALPETVKESFDATSEAPSENPASPPTPSVPASYEFPSPPALQSADDESELAQPQQSPQPTASPTPSASPTPPVPLPVSPSAPTPAPAPIPVPVPGLPFGGMPGAGNTGVPSGVNLFVHVGDLRITTPGTVIDGWDIRGRVTVGAANVTIKNSIIRGPAAGFTGSGFLVVNWGNANLQIVDSEISASTPNGYINGIVGNNYTLTRVDINTVIDSATIVGDNVTIRDSWLHDNLFYQQDPHWNGGPSHADSIQVQSGRDISITGNTIQAGQNAGVMITQDRGPVSNFTFRGNQADGGGCTINIAQKSYGPLYGVSIVDNTFGRNTRIIDCAIIAAPTTTVLMNLSNNHYTPDQTPVTVRRGA